MNEPVKIYHIVHIDNLPSIIHDGFLYSDAEMQKRLQPVVEIGMRRIKDRRLRLPLSTHPGLHVGECVPFYFCPRSPMLYMFHMRNSPDIAYNEGQEPIIHLVADLQRTVDWANNNGVRWAFTNSNAGSGYFEDYADLSDLDKINWEVVNAAYWREARDEKQAEFLIERCFPWELVEEIGVYSRQQQAQTLEFIDVESVQVKVRRDWYY